MASHKQPGEVKTPMMQQYHQIKHKYPDAILLFRVGDFYETFGEDALQAAQILGITLTRRSNGAAGDVPLAGFPYHALDTYLPKLVRSGKRVAVCDQLEDPKKTNKLVKRGLTELVTPGIAVGENVLENKENNYLGALYVQGDTYGIAFLDYSTGEFSATQGPKDSVEKLLPGYKPKELLVLSSQRSHIEAAFHPAAFICDRDDWIFSTTNNYQALTKQFGVSSLKGFGLEDYPLAVTAAGAVLHYLDLTQHRLKGHIVGISRIDNSSQVHIDPFTLRSLELLAPMNPSGRSLLQVLDRTSCPMGARLLRHYIAFPLKDVHKIHARQAVVQDLYQNPSACTSLSLLLSELGDLERLASKVAMRRVTPKEVLRLGQIIEVLEPIKSILSESNCPQVREIAANISLCSPQLTLIKQKIHPSAPNAVNKGNVIAPGVSAELDELRDLSSGSQNFLLQLQDRESQRTGISSLKVGFNNVFGYYLEVRNAHKEKVPPEWIRKQTLVGAERYITEELKVYEQKILGAQERILALETDLFAALLEDLQAGIPALQQDSVQLASLDVLLSFALVASEYDYVCPEVNEGRSILISQGRHPVIERELPATQAYVPNDVSLDPDDNQILIITGPNMSGKSALLRQTALIVLMAQMGAFVPAQKAVIGLTDAVFTRVGASDNISRGESTFMVEMQEAAGILNNLSDRSLVLFDELGRGTSTFDGISIAWSIIEYLHSRPGARPKTLFATHYHELNELEKRLERVHNFNVSARQVEGKMLFLRKLEPGGSRHSFGIEVAQLAGIPKQITDRAREVLHTLEGERMEEGIGSPAGSLNARKVKEDVQYQTSLFMIEDPLLIQIRDEILNVDLNNITPLDALNRLAEIRKLIQNL